MKRTQRPTFVFRAMLLSLFLPIFIMFGISGIYYIIVDASDQLWRNNSFIEILLTVFFLLFETLFTFGFAVWIFWSGKWRIPVLVGGIMMFCIFLLDIFGYLENSVPPEKRIICCGEGNYQKNDIYCNGVYLGQTPFKISVEELVAKVPEWTTPPEQYFYSRGNAEPSYFDSPIYTWFPWDGFREERFLETKTIIAFEKQSILSSAEQRKQLTKYETGCRYWWRLENNKNRILIRKTNYSQHRFDQPFEKISGYPILNETQSLSVGIHAWILVDVLGKLTESEKNDWDRHVLKHWQILGAPLTITLKSQAERYSSKNPDDPRAKIFETALDSVARLRYGLSNPPTEEECRRLLANWVDESINRSYGPHDAKPFRLGSIDTKSHIYNDYTHSSSQVSDEERPLIDAAIRLMGEAIRKPLVEQWKTNYYRQSDGWAPLLYLAKTDHNAEYFNEFVRYYAASCCGRLELLKNQNERVIPLFKTFLYQKHFIGIINGTINGNRDGYSPINFYSRVNNPLLEPVFREYVVRALSDPKLSNEEREKLNLSVVSIVVERISRGNIDENELALWVNSLPLPQLSKVFLIRNIQWNSQGTKSFANFLEEAADYSYIVETKMTVEDVIRWFTENPNGTVSEFCKVFAKDVVFSTVNNPQKRRTVYSPEVSEIEMNKGHLSTYLVRALWKINTPETQQIIKQLLNNTDNHNNILASFYREINHEFVQFGMAKTGDVNDYLTFR
ncbi:MAG: hypothetical protein LBU34_02625, partial [Planctomycetaceae bacterium]|nr:hypothetical protein [Planctomycetaceae bacterium]